MVNKQIAVSILITSGLIAISSMSAHANINVRAQLNTFTSSVDQARGPRRPPEDPEPSAEIDQRLQEMMERLDLRPFPRTNNTESANTPQQNAALPSLPSINSAKAQLGKQLFFAKNLGGEQSAACVSCHHPSLGGGDNLSLPVGVNATNELDQTSHDLLAHGRFNGNSADNAPTVPRNAPTVFNLGLINRGLFWDSRVESTRNGQIFTPDSAVDEQGRRRPDSTLPANTTLAAAQARFPVTSVDEMRGGFLLNSDNRILRQSLAKRFDNSEANFDSTWPAAFLNAFNEVEITFERIADAIGEYERSMVFTQSPWNAYLAGDETALDQQQKAGAMLFFTSTRDGGAGCVACHRGPTLSDERHHLVAFPQIGVGKGNVSNTETSHDFGRENITNNEGDRYHFKTPGLLNVAVTAPYGHSGAYQTLEQVVSHYNDPRRTIDELFVGRGNAGQDNQGQISEQSPYCQLPQIQDLTTKNNQSCASIFPDAYTNSVTVVDHLQSARNGQVPANAPFRARVRLSAEQVSEVVAFLRSLTDPCVESRECLAPWIIDENDVASFPDDNPLVGHDRSDIAL